MGNRDLKIYFNSLILDELEEQIELVNKLMYEESNQLSF